MAKDPDTFPLTEGEELARLRIWTRVQRGMVAHHRRRVLQATLAGAAGACATGVVTLLIIF